MSAQTGFTEADERAWTAFASAYIAGRPEYISAADAARYADRLLEELQQRRPAERKDGPYR